jgi:hypothetical protein
MMRMVLSLLLVTACALRGSNLYRCEVKRGSDLEKELGYELSVQDKHDGMRAEGMDETFPIEGPALEDVVKFRGSVTDRLKDLFELRLTLSDANGTLLQVPLAIRTRWNKENEIRVQFLIKKELINQAVLTICCGGSPQGENNYAIRLGDVPVLSLPEKSPPKKSLLEAVAIAEEFLRSQKIDASKGVLVWVEFRNYLRNEREDPRWHIASVFADERVDVWVSQDGSTKLTRGRGAARFLPNKSLTEAVAIGEEFLRTQNMDLSKHVLLRAEFKIATINERETAFWEIAWGLRDQRIVVSVFQDGSTKLIHGR